MPAPNKPKAGDPYRGRLPSTHTDRPLAEVNDGKLFRVRDKDWERIWGENLTHEEATALCTKITANRKSRTARIEDMEIGPPDGVDYTPPAPRGHAPEQSQPEAPPITPAPYKNITVETRGDKKYTYGIKSDTGIKVVLKVESKYASKPAGGPPVSVPKANTQLTALQSGAMAAAGQAAREAQARADAVAERDRMYAKAADLDQMLNPVGDGGDDLVDDGEIHDLTAGLGEMPTDEEIAAAANGAGVEIIDDDADSDAPAV